jgi:uncharacterized membrane protein SpoIIM required for sporulation
MVGHGVIELSCIFIAGGAGMLIGYSMINPGDLTRAQALKKNGLEAVRLAIGCAILLVMPESSKVSFHRPRFRRMLNTAREF